MTATQSRAIGLLVVASFASGAVVSATDMAPAWVMWVHKVAPWLTAVVAAAALNLTAS